MQVEVYNGKGVIDIISDGFLHYLKINTPKALVWPDCRGSIAKYYVIAQDNSNLPEIDILREILVSAEESQICLQMEKFLSLFTNGVYYIWIRKNITAFDLAYNYETYFDITNKNQYHTAPINSDVDHITNSYYDWSTDYFVFTRPLENLNANRIKFFEGIIKKGLRPKPIVFSKYYQDVRGDSDHSFESALFILDGHHKLMAYHNLKIKPEIVHIEKWQDTKVEPFEGSAFNNIQFLLHPSQKAHILKHRD